MNAGIAPGGPLLISEFAKARSQPSLQHLAMALRDAADTEIQVIAYRAGVVDVRLTAPDVATLDQIRKSVSESAQFTATIQSTDQVGDRVNSRIQIREVGS